jgi:hypothetical protein
VLLCYSACQHCRGTFVYSPEDGGSVILRSVGRQDKIVYCTPAQKTTMHAISEEDLQCDSFNVNNNNAHCGNHVILQCLQPLTANSLLQTCCVSSGTVRARYCWLPLAVSGANPGMKKCSRGKGTIFTASLRRSAFSWPGNLRHVVTPDIVTWSK